MEEERNLAPQVAEPTRTRTRLPRRRPAKDAPSAHPVRPFDPSRPSSAQEGSRPRRGNPRHHSPETQPEQSPANDREVLRFVPLGGLEEIGRNMMFVEY